MPITVTGIARHPLQIVAECCSFVSLASEKACPRAGPSRDRDIGYKTLRALAGTDRREEDRDTPQEQNGR
jgi:hypothetical protein